MHRLKLQIRYKIYKGFDAKYSGYRVLLKNSYTIKTVHIFMLNLIRLKKNLVEIDSAENTSCYNSYKVTFYVTNYEFRVF